MNFPEGLFGHGWSLWAFLPLAIVWLWCLRTAPWRRLADSRQLNVWLGSVVVLMLVWSMKAGVRPGLNLHLLGATALTLMFGRQLAILGLSVVMAAVTLNGAAGWEPYALNVLVTAVFPSVAAHALLRVVERYLPANFFCYIFCAAFFGAAIAVVATGLLASLVLWLAGVYTAEMLVNDYLPYYTLLGFAEAWLNGAAITLMVVYYPDWVGSFDDRRYFFKR
ncbi:MAG: energy-coupling factor ABC transporter permease [Rhodocyclaceae bacterium]|nr:energy-coupling factor ABC transporter permease [Rhodocyclaceae bacterium]MBK6552491.1 energy-coupling factor ABC transporter permease [Rhodocyclaceae bacterium]MBK6675584.1 energy-coupling factor ABC transporter permease [Rhodocyclaceae bacterium]MBK9312027.1 energy-coupling factor ABC transporter permease [Rhodocyclaceae bacterium]